jgi:hypothetical protein|tara:strand:+ start:13703 stop:13888 length:186 start_codon:yes stop_codon:yes gene_type:complete
MLPSGFVYLKGGEKVDIGTLFIFFAQINGLTLRRQYWNIKANYMKLWSVIRRLGFWRCHRE